eukprot:g46169.t1
MGGQSEGAETRSKTKEQEKVEQAAGSEPSVQVQQPPSVKAQCSSDTGSKTSTSEAVASPKHQTSEVAKLDSPAPTSELKGPPKETGKMGMCVTAPAGDTDRTGGRLEMACEIVPEVLTHVGCHCHILLTATRALVIELDHNKFKCKIPECSKAFRKAKMLHYHMKYYHGMEKAEPDPSSPKRSMQTRGSCASEGESLLDSPKRRRTTSGSIQWSQQASHRALQSSSAELRAPRLNEKRRMSTLSSLDIAAQSRLSLRDKSKDNQTERSHQKLQDREKGCAESGSRERSKEKKLRDFLKVKLKKKKKKKKKSKSGELFLPILYKVFVTVKQRIRNSLIPEGLAT